MSKRQLTNGFLACFLVLILIDGLPSTSLFHGRLKRVVDPLLDASGLWQQSWQLFAPEVDKMNVRMSATFRYVDGEERAWQSPDWPDMGSLEKFVRFREMEFVDAVRQDANAGAWASYARFLERRYGHPNKELSSITLRRHWVTVPPPTAGDRQTRQWPLPMEGSYTIWQSANLEGER